jgi:hypothetical protein
MSGIGTARRMPTSLAEFVRRYPIRKTECGCLKWTGGTVGKAYGGLAIGGRHFYAHKLAWQLVNGEIPQGMVLSRKVEQCDEAMCINPEHWELVTRGQVCKLNAKRGVMGGKLHAIRVMIGRRKRAKLTIEKAREIRARAGERADVVAKAFDIDRSMVYGIWRGDYWPEALQVAGSGR